MAGFLEVSAKTGENVEDAFLRTAEEINKKIQNGSLELSSESSGIKLGPMHPSSGRSGVLPVGADGDSTDDAANSCC